MEVFIIIYNIYYIFIYVYIYIYALPVINTMTFVAIHALGHMWSTVIFYLPQGQKCLRGFLFGQVIFLTFHEWLLMDSSRGFIFAYLSFNNVLYILIFSRFALQLAVCESRNSYPNFWIFQIALFGYKRLNSRLNV